MDDTGGGGGVAVGLDGRGEGGVLVGAAVELLGVVVDVVGRALVVLGLAGADVAVGRGLVVADPVADRVAEELVGSADGDIGAEPAGDAMAPPPVAVPADCLAALPGVAYTLVLRRAGVVALRCWAARAASRAASTCCVS